MRQVLQRRGNHGRAFVLMLVVCLALFAIYLKAGPQMDGPSSGNSPTQVKFWVKTTASQNTKVKLVTVDGFILIPPPTTALLQRPLTSRQTVPAAAFIIRDAFAGPSHWFRPPPLS
jgi:hypothetical protein